MKDIIKMVAALVLFATAACAGLAIVYDSTKEKIAVNAESKLKTALEELFPEAEEFIPVKGEKNFRVVKNGITLGYIIDAEVNGFNDVIEALVAVRTNGSLNGIRLLRNTDTPGLGAKASDEKFYGQFAGKTSSDDLRVSKDGGSIQAITAATVTSRAVSNLVQNAVQTANEHFNNEYAVEEE